MFDRLRGFFTKPRYPVSGVPGGWKHLAVVPFEALFALFVLIGGALALINYGGTGSDAVTLLLPHALNVGVQVAYALSGLLILVGLWKPRRDIEAAGLSLLAASAVVRGFAVVAALGLHDVAVVSTVFNLLLVAGCYIRLRTIFSREVIVSVKP